MQPHEINLFPPGHYYSPIPSLQEVLRHEERIFNVQRTALPGLDMNAGHQLVLLEEFRSYYAEQSFPEEPAEGFRYFFQNPAYSYTDALFLYCMLRHARPQRLIEVGSGYSSCVTLDTNERFFSGAINCTFIEPHADLLRKLLKPSDPENVVIIEAGVQDVPLDLFRELQANDILFIDSTHVSKTGSDVNYLVFDVLPLLRPGVLIHFHDIFYPFEYPKAWVMEGRAWNECYLLRSFLMFNAAFRIELFSNYMALFHRKLLAESLPLCAKNWGGNLWLRKIL